MSIKQEKIKRLKEHQDTIRNRRVTPFALNMQQTALKRSLLLKKPIIEDRNGRVQRLKETQKVNRDLSLVRQKEQRERQRVFEAVRREKNKISQERKINDLYFPRRTAVRKKTRRRIGR